MSHPITPRTPPAPAVPSRASSRFHDALFDLQDRVIILAGAAGGLGRELAQGLHNRGAKLGLMDLPGDALKDLARSLPGSLSVAVDIRDEAALEWAAGSFRQQLGPITGAINAAGILTPAPALDLPEDALRRTFEVNVLGAFLFSRVMARVMMGTENPPNAGLADAGGCIVHLASVSSLVANEGYAAYAPSKAALSQMVRVLAREWAASGLRVNAIGPSLSRTEMTRDALDDPARRAQALGLIPMGRFCEGADLIGPVVMLLSDAGRYITGQTIYVDGGRTLT